MPQLYSFPAGPVKDQRGPLVNSLKSQQSHNPETKRVHGFAVYHSTVKILRGKTNSSYAHSGGKRAAISNFSESSKRNLKFKAANAFPHLISQFCLTYQKKFCQGHEIKKHLNRFLTYLRRTYPTVKYLWILEFQTRGFPHYHLFLNLSRNTPGLHEFLAQTWNKITKEGEEHLSFHLHERNFIDWEMGNGSYICKYLDKEAQKAVPEGFTDIGRFWGCSRGLVPPPKVYTEEELTDYAYPNAATGEISPHITKNFITRALCRLHEVRLKVFGKKSRARHVSTSFTLHNCCQQFQQLLEYCNRQALIYCPF